jgi:transposase
LYEICGDKSASQVGRETGRNPQTVMEWVHRYHTVGPAVLVYQPTGGRSPYAPV